MNYAIRVTLPYDDCKHIIAKWADRCISLVVYQHDADEEISKTHIHIGIYKSEVRAEALKRMWPDAPGKGNEFWSFKDWDVELHPGTTFMKPNKYLTYMTKGHLRPNFVKNISNDLLEESRQAWVEPSLGNDNAGKDYSERLIREVLQKFDSQTFKTHYRVDDMEDDDIGIETVFQQVRVATFKHLWGVNRRVPHASHYKMIAGSVFMRLCERLNRLDEAISILQDKWY